MSKRECEREREGANQKRARSCPMTRVRRR